MPCLYTKTTLVDGARDTGLVTLLSVRYRQFLLRSYKNDLLIIDDIYW